MDNKSEQENIYKKPPIGIGKDGEQYTAMIVDDSRVVRQLLKQILRSVKFNIIDGSTEKTLILE